MKLFRTAALAAAVALVATGCGLDSADPSTSSGARAAAGSLAKVGDLSGVSVSVGGKEFTEQLILCELTAQALESAGATVKRVCGMSGSATVRAALLSGDIDMYWEYTGTGWLTHLKETKPIADPDAMYKAVNEADQQRNGITWLKPAAANNTYAIAVAADTATKLGVATMSDYAKLAANSPSEATFCGAAEFFGRNDGWPGVEKSYGFQLPDGDVAHLDAGAVYNAVAKGNPCNFGEVFATDGRIQALNLTVLDDDKHFFLPYNPAVSIRSAVLKKTPAIGDVLDAVSAALDNTTLQSLNAKVDVDGETPEETAHAWLLSKGLIGE